MKILINSFLLFLIFSLSVIGQVLVGDNGDIQVETSIAVHPTDPNIIAVAALELRSFKY